MSLAVGVQLNVATGLVPADVVKVAPVTALFHERETLFPASAGMIEQMQG